MANCLKTQLKEVVQNPDLLIMGELRLEALSDATVKVGEKIAGTKVKNLTQNFTGLDTNEVEIPIDLSGNGSVEVGVHAGDIISIQDKYNLTSLRGGKSLKMNIKELDYMPEMKALIDTIFTGDMSELKNQNANLIYFYMRYDTLVDNPYNNGEFKSNLSKMALYPNMSLFKSVYVSHAGRFSDLGFNSSISSITLMMCEDESTIEAYVANRLTAQPNTAGSVLLEQCSSSNITYQGVKLPNTPINLTLAWDAQGNITLS